MDLLAGHRSALILVGGGGRGAPRSLRGGGRGRCSTASRRATRRSTRSKNSHYWSSSTRKPPRGCRTARRERDGSDPARRDRAAGRDWHYEDEDWFRRALESRARRPPPLAPRSRTARPPTRDPRASIGFSPRRSTGARRPSHRPECSTGSSTGAASRRTSRTRRRGASTSGASARHRGYPSAYAGCGPRTPTRSSPTPTASVRARSVSQPPVSLPQLAAAARARAWDMYPEYEFRGALKNAAFKHRKGPKQGGFGWVVGIGIDNDDIYATVNELRTAARQGDRGRARHRGAVDDLHRAAHDAADPRARAPHAARGGGRPGRARRGALAGRARRAGARPSTR